jgi:hypothetical protein
MGVIIVFMLKAILIALVIFALFLGLLVILQPSPQDMALGNLAAAEKILERPRSSEAAGKLDEASKALKKVDVAGDAKKQLDQAVANVEAARTDVETATAKLDASATEVKAQLEQAKNNLSAPTALERAKGVKDQILALLWPLVAAALIFYILHSQSSLSFFKQLAAVISNVKIPGGLEIQFAGSAVKSTQEEVLRGYREQVIVSYDAVSMQHKISETVNRIVEDLEANFFQGKLPEKFRCTVHVQDMLFQHSLYQLIDYLPRRLWGSKTATRGRAWSVRRGLVGQSWRLEENKASGSVPKDVNELIRDWGMTKAEAELAAGRQTLLCFLVKAKNQSPVAALYVDAEPENAFGDKAGMAGLMTAMDAAVKKYGLDQALEAIWQKVQDSAPLIEIYGDNK